jgi:hypothetical protein
MKRIAKNIRKSMPTTANKVKVLILKHLVFKKPYFLLAAVGYCWTLLAVLACWQG